MHRAVLFALPLILAGLPLAAQTGTAQTRTAQTGAPLGAEAFDAISRGRTLTYATGGQVYGIEQYLPNRRVRWAFVDDLCKEGHWYPEGEQICFEYDGMPDRQCWTFYDTPGGLTARFAGDPESEPLVAVEDSAEPLACLGPEVGV